MASFMRLTIVTLLSVLAILPFQKAAAQYVAGPQMQQKPDHTDGAGVWKAPKPNTTKPSAGRAGAAGTQQPDHRSTSLLWVPPKRSSQIPAATSSNHAATMQQQLDQYDHPGLRAPPKANPHKALISNAGGSASMQQQLDQYDRPGLWKSPRTPAQKTLTPGTAAQKLSSTRSGVGLRSAAAAHPEPPWAPPASNMRLPKASFSSSNLRAPGTRVNGAPRNMTSAQMEQMLNQYDSANLWNRGSPNQAPAQSRMQPGAFPANSAGQAPFFPMQNSSGQNGISQIGPAAGLFGGQQRAAPQTPVSPFAALFGGAPQAPKAPPPPANPMQAMLRMFLGDGSSSGSEAQNQEKTGNAQSYLQTAIDAASRAQSACERASSGSDMDARKSAAQEAYYDAQAARGAADSATSAAAGGPSEANDAAAQARDAADRAQASADRASANASSSGW